MSILTNKESQFSISKPEKDVVDKISEQYIHFVKKHLRNCTEREKGEEAKISNLKFICAYPPLIKFYKSKVAISRFTRTESFYKPRERP